MNIYVMVLTDNRCISDREKSRSGEYEKLCCIQKEKKTPKVLAPSGVFQNLLFIFLLLHDLLCRLPTSPKTELYFPNLEFQLLACRRL